MAAVFEIRNPDGSLHLDLSSRVTRFLGSYTIQTSQPRGSITHPAFGTQGTPFFFPLGAWPGNFPGALPKLFARADRIDWEYYSSIAGPINVTILYGVF